MRTTSDASARRLFIWVLGVGVALGGIAFAYKIAGFVWTLSSRDFAGTFDVSITVYFFVSAGWLCLLVWSLLTGKFTRDTAFPADDHRNYNRAGEAFDVGETFSGVPYEIGVQAARELAPLVPKGKNGV